MTRDSARKAADTLRAVLAELPPRTAQDAALALRVEGAALALDVLAEGRRT